MFDGRKYPLVKNATGTWRIRSRNQTHAVDIGLGTSDLLEAKRVAKQKLEEIATKKKPKGNESLEDATKVYEQMPKKCSDIAAEHNVGRLKRIVSYTWNKELSQAKIAASLPDLWTVFMAKKQADLVKAETGEILTKLDLSTRRPQNARINSAVKQAASIFIKELRPVYKKHGIIIPEDATVVQWLPTVKAPPPTADVRNMDVGIEELATVASDMYFCLGLARWAGLRRAEIKACRRDWIIEDRGQVFVLLHDRPDEGYLTKTGAVYRAMVINPVFAQALLAVPEGMMIVNPATTDRDGWFEREPQEWLRPYTGKAKKPLHRLRGLYADDVKRITEDAILARAEAIKEASKNLGHTTTATTQKSYLSHEEKQTHT